MQRTLRMHTLTLQITVNMMEQKYSHWRWQLMQEVSMELQENLM